MTRTSLEKIVQLPKELKSEALIGNHTYAGRAFDLYFDGTSIRGNASLEKRRIVALSVKEPSQFFVIGAQVYNAVADVVNAAMAFPFGRFATISSDGGWKVTGEGSYEYFISNGKALTDPHGMSGYRVHLFKNLSKEGIIVDGEVFDAVFNSIDQELMKFYQQAFSK